MVFKPFTHLARQSFAKPFAHGTAQSLVATFQPLHTSSATQFGPFSNHSASRFGKAGTSQLQNAFHNNSGANNKSSTAAISADSGGDGGLDAYYDAWQKHQRSGEEKEWEQFQFTKRIGWKPSPPALEGKAREKDGSGLRPEVLPDRVSLGRAYSTSAVDDIKKIGQVVAEDDVVAADSGFQKQSSDLASKQAAASPAVSEGLGAEAADEVPFSLLSGNSSTTAKSPITSELLASDRTSTTSLQASESQSFVEHITKLENAQCFAEIPPVFESMLLAGVRPTAQTYNALLAAAINLPRAKHQIVPKALDVYADMLCRKVSPNTTTYATLIGLLSSRALDVLRMKTSLREVKMRYGGMQEAGQFMFRSHDAEHDILSEDEAGAHAMKLFKLSTTGTQQKVYATETYCLLIQACAARGEVENMIRVYSHMEANKVIPNATIFAPMINAFAVSGDLSSAVECYNEYKSLAVMDDHGKFVIVQRADHEVYAAVVKAYTVCGKPAGSDRFLSKITNSFNEESQAERLSDMRNTVVLEGLIQERLDKGSFLDAFDIALKHTLSPSIRAQAMARICAAAADNGDTEVATRAYHYVTPHVEDRSIATLAMLAMHIRQGNVNEARAFWPSLSAFPNQNSGYIEPTAMYSVALIGSGHIDEGLMEARHSFARIRSSIPSGSLRTEVTEEVDEGIEFVGRYLAGKLIVPSPHASMSFMWAMMENGGFVSPVAEQLLAGLGPDDILKLSWQDLTLALEVEAGLLANGQITLDIAHRARFLHLVEAAIENGLPLDKRVSDLVESCLVKLDPQFPEISERWQNYRHPIVRQSAPPTPYTSQSSYLPQSTLSVAPPLTFNEAFDPYAATTDYKGSTVIVEELDRHNGKTDTILTEVLSRFRNMRRAGRHPRYMVYAKMIAAAAKDGRANVMHDILAMAKQDMPYVPQYRVVRNGWYSILDAMIGACLTTGNRTAAAHFHQELLDMGSAPTANTFGLYITTLKESTKTFDEATEAVKIFHRAKSEGVEPSSFLYNALIGKLGKARRIDDCLFYFAEMRSHGIRPTSVTYGTIVNALCRVSDERFAEELFDEMETMPNYKPRPAPYNSLMQFFLTTKRDSNKVLEYYTRMQSRKIQPTMHTYKLLIDTYATLDPIDMPAAEKVLEKIRASGQRPEAVHYASLIHAKGCASRDMPGARKIFDDVLTKSEIHPQACLYQALFESMVANHCVAETEKLLEHMSANRVEITPYIANTLIHGWATEKNVARSKSIYDNVGKNKREPSTYEAMTRAFLAVEDRDSASTVVREMLSRGYPSAVSGKILELLGHGMDRANGAIPSSTMECKRIASSSLSL
ncbi:hypothetical protein MMC06_006484 [Schaereria dolodes]|nr:hypothetical protein [Schaereria dolodes]